jgi:hypothetical protein
MGSVSDELCFYIVDCTGAYDDVDQCIDDECHGREDCFYDSEKADACIEALEDLQCEGSETPDVCDEVWDCPDQVDGAA